MTDFLTVSKKLIFFCTHHEGISILNLTAG